MTVACRMVNCPHNNENICSATTILINQDGRCFDLAKGFRPEEASKIREEYKLDIEDVEIVENTEQSQEVAEETLNDTNRGDEPNDNE